MFLLCVAGLPLSTIHAQKKEIIDDEAPNGIVIVTIDKAGDEIIRIMNESQLPYIHDPKAPRFLLMDKQGKFALGIGGYGRATGEYDFGGIVDDIDFVPANIPSSSKIKNQFQMPGLVIDIYARTAVMQAHSAGMHLDRMAIADALTEVMGNQIDNIYYKSETTLPFKADLYPENGFLKGGSTDNVAMEYGLKFHIDWLKGQKTGFFVDQRENRSLLERYAKGRSVLNMFCYTGGFSVYAMRGDAKLVHSVDSSAKAIDLTNKNIELNFPGDTRHAAYAEDAFKYLDRMGDQYDLIVLDPPAFAKHRDALRNALQGYRKLNVKAFEKIKPGGILFTFSCSQAVSKENFRTAVFTAAAMSGRSVRILHQLTQPADHPVSIYHPEGEYLKGLVLYVE